MVKTIKKAVSIPEGTYRKAEAWRKKMGASRSELYATALEAYFGLQQVREMEARYAAGYRKKPEKPAESESFLAAGLSSLEAEDW